MDLLALQVQAPKFESPIESQGKALQLRQLMQADQMGQYQQQQAQQAMQDDASYRTATQANPSGGQGLIDALGTRGNYKGQAAAIKAAQDARKGNADIAKTEGETKASAATSAGHQFEIAGQLVGAWANNPGVTKQQISAGLIAAQNSGIISPEIAKAKLGELDATGDDPTSLNGWAKTTLMQITKAQEQHALTTVDANTRATNERIKTEGDLNRKNQIQVQKMAADRQGSGGSGGVSLTHGIKGLSPEQNAALSGSINAGLLNPNRVNGRTASLYADLILKNPNTDFNKLGANANLLNNPAFQQKAMTADTLPEVMNNMVEAGKKVGFSDNRTIGKMQAWLKGEFNDPDYTAYMVQRNDGLMGIAGVMRGVGMTDMAHKAESEASNPTMSPGALDAWLKSQMISLTPRLRRNAQIMHTTPPGGAAPVLVAPSPGVGSPTPVAAPGARPSLDAFFTKK